MYELCKIIIDYSENLIYTDSLNNLNTLDSIVNVDGDISVTPSYSTDGVDCYGTGTSILYMSGIFPWLGQYIIVYGDVNGDGVCDVLDCMLVELTKTGNTVLEDSYLTAGDFDGDSNITINDFQQVVNKAKAE